ncbi:ComF family protein [Horticoccus sp. 23ND18S-11]|uniref:ComF family protein n=1 Tax=Horticoccus sp. 23ND18S-11 TaxID=3391832 RepID=UPI0039C92422
MNAALRDLAHGLADVIFPPVCVHCRALVEAGEPEVTVGPDGDIVAAGPFRHLCRRCVAHLEFVRPPHCVTCGHPFYGIVEGERTCEKCLGLEPVFDEGRTAVLFKGPARALVIELKYHRGWHVLADMAEIFRRSPHVLERVRGSVLVPVPLHPRKARERGYNQAELLARALAEAAGGGTRVAALLRRRADTQSQTAFDRRTRMANLKNAFALAPGAAINPALHYTLVDDVFTTGSTLNSCARALRGAGGLSLDVVTFGHG